MATNRTTKPRATVTRLHTESSRTGQNAHFAALLTISAPNPDPGFASSVHKLRARIVSDSHRSQMVGRIERWNGATWCEVWSLDPARMQTPGDTGYKRTAADDGAFDADLETLIDRAIQVLL